MLPVILALVAGVLLTIIPVGVYAESDFVFSGNGFGTVRGNIEASSLQMSLQMPASGNPEFQEGHLLLGDNVYSLDDADVLLFYNKKLLRINAKADDTTIFASGRLVSSVGNDSIYQLTGRTSNHDAFSVFAKLQEEQLPVKSTPDPVQKKEILLLVKQSERVEWKYPYKFTIRTFDPELTPISDFYNTSGYLEGIQISATITNPTGSVIKTSSGATQKFGYYDDSIIIPDNARTGTYKLSVTASGNNYQDITQEFTFVVIPSSTPS